MSDLVKKHWPHVHELSEVLNGMHGKTIRVPVDIKAIHEGLLKLQRQSGSLGLNK